MGEFNRHELLEHKMCEEVKLIEKKYENGGAAEMDINDLKKLDLLYHTLKSKATYDAMKEAEEYGYDRNQMSGRMMPRMSGHYYDDRSYSDGYSGGYPYPPRPRW